MKKALVLILILLLSISLVGCIGVQQKQGGELQNEVTEAQNNDEATVSEYEDTSSVIYKNTQYGFTFPLPESWKDYKIITREWEGLSLADLNEGEVVETGPMISIRHPKWTSEDQRQDIPMMIFTLDQWKSLEQEKFHIGAAPMEPKELARNSKFVFALPARYNYAFPMGYEEVEKILEDNPLQANENII